MQRTPDTINNAVNLLQPGDEGAFHLLIYFNFDSIDDEDIEKHEDEGMGQYNAKHSVMTKYKNFDIAITIKYRDMYQNEFSQKIILSSQMHMQITKDGKASHLCDIYLKETTVPVKTKR